MPFIAKGIELGYAESSVKVIHHDIAARRREQPPERMRLDPTTMLVPIQIVKLLPPESAGSIFTALDQISVEARNRLFDRRPGLDLSTTSHPNGEVYVSAQYTEQAPTGIALNFTEPDLIWAQCGIQFRAVSCNGLDDAGLELCPDVHISQPLANVACLTNPNCNISAAERVLGFGDLNQCGCENCIASNNLADARKVAGVRTDIPIALFTGNVTNPLCGGAGETLDFADTGHAFIATLNQGNDTRTVLAHELGHVLGLRHFTGIPNIMSPFAADMSTFVPQELCLAARTKAAEYVKAKWGGTVVDPAKWTVTLPPPP